VLLFKFSGGDGAGDGTGTGGAKSEQRFPLAIGDIIRQGKPGPDAGEIGKPGQIDVYRFSGKGKRVVLLSQPVAGECPASIDWKLVHEDSGTTVFDNSMGRFGCNAPFDSLGEKLKTGAYTLTVYGEVGATGAYRFALLSR
jgi:hypothetical protein